MSDFRLACLQIDVAFRDPIANADRLAVHLTDLARRGVSLAVFPEAFLTGYVVGSPEDARSLAIPADHEAINICRRAVNETGVAAVFGFAEVEGEKLYNTALMMIPGEPDRRYRKTHLPHLGYDRFTLPGNDLPVFDTPWGRIGVLICYDLRPPEPMRTLALQDADLVVLPTNWPVGAETAAKPVSLVRAIENRVFLATCNRVGTEEGTTFIGLSKIIDPKGNVLAEAGAEESILVADLNLQQAREKVIVNIPGEYEMDLWGSRQPQLYEPIVANRRPLV